MSIGSLNIGDVAIGSAGLGIAPSSPVKAAPTRPTNGRTPAPHYVNFFALDGSVDLTLPMGDGPAMLSGGDPTWHEEARRGLSPVTWWENQTSYRQSIPILLDSAVDWEDTIQLLRSLKRSPGARTPPPQVAIAGQAIHRADITWVVEGVDEGTNVIREATQGGRTRQDIIVRLLQFGALETVVERSPSRQAASRGGSKTVPSRGPTTYRVTANDHSLRQIAARKDIYNDEGQWKKIAAANGIRDPRSLKVGRVLKIPR